MCYAEARERRGIMIGEMGCGDFEVVSVVVVCCAGTKLDDLLSLD